MRFFATLSDLLKEDEKSRAIFDRLPVDAQVMLKEQRQDICTRDALEAAAEGLEKRTR